jgi:hypothetical protein
MTDSVSKFKSNQNKGIIWALLNDHNVFNGIDNKYVTSIKAEFDTKIDLISNTISTTDTLVTLNKKVISEMMNEMTKYKIQGQSIQGGVITIPITSAETQLQKQTLFQKNLETKQSEFDTLINKPKPTTIDFADNNGQDKPNSSEMERKLAETIAWREKELKVVLDTQTKSNANISEASKWINRDNVSSSENNLILKIDKTTPVDINVINLDNKFIDNKFIDNKFKKKVSFPDTKERVPDTKERVPDTKERVPDTKERVPDTKDLGLGTEPIADNFLSLLKKKDTHNTSYNLDEDMIFMKTQLKELMDKQNVILENQNVILENQTVMLKIINELHIKPTDVISPGINLEITE